LKTERIYLMVIKSLKITVFILVCIVLSSCSKSDHSQITVVKSSLDREAIYLSELDDTDYSVQWNAINALSHLKSKSAIPKIIQWFQKRDYVGVNDWLRIATKLDDFDLKKAVYSKAIENNERRWSSEDNGERYYFHFDEVESLKKSADEQIRSWLFQGLPSIVHPSQKELIAVLKAIADPRFYSWLENRLSHPELFPYAIEAMFACNREKAIPFICQKLIHGSKNEKKRLMRIFSYKPDPLFKSTLRDLYKKKDPEIDKWISDYLKFNGYDQNESFNKDKKDYSNWPGINYKELWDQVLTGNDSNSYPEEKLLRLLDIEKFKSTDIKSIEAPEAGVRYLLLYSKKGIDRYSNSNDIEVFKSAVESLADSHPSVRNLARSILLRSIDSGWYDFDIYTFPSADVTSFVEKDGYKARMRMIQRKLMDPYVFQLTLDDCAHAVSNWSELAVEFLSKFTPVTLKKNLSSSSFTEMLIKSKLSKKYLDLLNSDYKESLFNMLNGTSQTKKYIAIYLLEYQYNPEFDPIIDRYIKSKDVDDYARFHKSRFKINAKERLKWRNVATKISKFEKVPNNLEMLHNPQDFQNYPEYEKILDLFKSDYNQAIYILFQTGMIKELDALSLILVIEKIVAQNDSRSASRLYSECPKLHPEAFLKLFPLLPAGAVHSPLTEEAIRVIFTNSNTLNFFEPLLMAILQSIPEKKAIGILCKEIKSHSLHLKDDLIDLYQKWPSEKLDYALYSLLQTTLNNPDYIDLDNSKSIAITKLILEILFQRGRINIINYAKKLLNHSDWRFRQAIIQALARVPSDRNRALIQSKLTDDVFYIREEAKKILESPDKLIKSREFIPENSVNNDNTQFPRLLFKISKGLEILHYNKSNHEYSTIASLDLFNPQRISVAGDKIFAASINRLFRLNEKLFPEKELEIGPFATMTASGNAVFVCDEGCLMTFDRDFNLLHKLLLGINSYSNGYKDAHDISINGTDAFLLDNIASPVFILKVDCRDLAQLKITGLREVWGVYHHLYRQAVDQKKGDWIILQKDHNNSGSHQNILLFSTKDLKKRRDFPTLNGFPFEDTIEKDLIDLTSEFPIWALRVINESVYLVQIDPNSPNMFIGNAIPIPIPLEMFPDNIFERSYQLDDKLYCCIRRVGGSLAIIAKNRLLLVNEKKRKIVLDQTLPYEVFECLPIND